MQRNKRFLQLYAVNDFCILLFFYLKYGMDVVYYPLLMSAFLLLAFMSIESIKFHVFVNKMNEAKKSPVTDIDYFQVNDRIVFGAVNEIHQKYYDELYRTNRLFKERSTLFSGYIHNMKTSITVIELALTKALEDDFQTDCLADVAEENYRLKKHLDDCLNVLRLDDFAKDYIPEKTSLLALVSTVVNLKKKDFIYQGVYPKVSIEAALEVYTDKKWCGYVIEQILGNAIKYSKDEGYIDIAGNKQGEEILLSIRDNGIGIAEQDLPRVFQPFFTGDNGRLHRESSGIGLYMVKETIEKLGHQVYIRSEKGRGTTVVITFSHS